ncbi:MAG: FAD:protein FMN transferase [Clostridium sp.]|nr:FAD:protein FMN transferase [Acetatifactor muris]MCM1528074.1 FAD:protein FMN transferase [Bacteroides sp.]MCM1564286.1 FAD:protein FMN transferase [Clostridium sp.]
MKGRGKKGIAALALLAAAVICVILIWQQGQRTAHTKSFFAMDTFFVLTAYGPEAEDALEQCAGKVEELESLWSVTREDSDIARLNRHARGSMAEEAIKVAPETFVLVDEALRLGRETKGALDITLYPVLREWGFTTGEYRIPEVERLEELLAKTDYTQVETDEDTLTIFLPKDMELDLGAVAKGYTGDCLTALLREQGITSALLDLGGNILALGTKPDGSLWRVAVQDPFDREKPIGVLEIYDKCVITSGNYERYFTGEDGREYWHILDPADGYPADAGLVSVTVVGDNGLRCDGLSTALFVMGKEQAVEFWRQQGDFGMILVTRDGELYLTEDLEESFACGEDWTMQILYKEAR